MNSISPKNLKPKLTAEAEIAFLDVREHGQYGEGHPFFSVHVGYSTIEVEVTLLVPRKDVTVVVMDDGDGVSERALHTLQKLGYTNVMVLEGGAPGWAAAGYTLFKGVNVPSKTFGELVEHECMTPSLSADELQLRLERDEPTVVLDGRPEHEYFKMSIPSARSCPNAELAYRIPALAINPETTLVINCAGRTRSIIGAETLRQCGFSNPILALRNGTQGWALSGFNLNHGIHSDPLPIVDPEARAQAVRTANNLIKRLALPQISSELLEKWEKDSERTTYIFDVRTDEEFSAGHWPNARHAPGGQLVQATDQYLAVRNSRIILCDDTGLRAATTAMWLRGMGHDVTILDEDVSQAITSKVNYTVASIVIDAPLVSSEAAFRRVAKGTLLIDASRSQDYRRGHANGSIWITRSRVKNLDCGSNDAIVVTGQEESLILGVVREFIELGFTDLHWFGGSPEIWSRAGFEIVKTPHFPTDQECIDFLFFVHDRHDGNMDAARRYLEWETGLLAQLDDQERGTLKPPQFTSTI
ncbi:rhodanese-like domain-containing protein [Candidatus Puniceispirillum sp.]|nr:rhodanese-like domain-containing protein [Candidatus Puniceispirillum sp.]